MGIIIKNGIEYGGGSDEVPSASEIPYDSNTSVKEKIDELDNIKQNNVVGGGYVGIDFDDYKTQGNYWVDLTGASNAPTGGYGYLEVVQTSARTCLQRFTKFASSGVHMAITWVRYFANNQWYAWVNITRGNTCSITRQSDVSTSVPIPDIDRRGNVVIIHFAHQFPAGTYYQLYDVTPKPIRNEHAIVDLGGANKAIIDIFTNGTMRFNNSQTLSVTQYVIGQLVYLTDEV